MASYEAQIAWHRPPEQTFIDGSYSRAHEWTFDGGTRVPASASPLHVRPPLSDPSGVDPEEAYVATLSSCHMLFFLWLSARKGFAVLSYKDAAVGLMTKETGGREWISQVTLRPQVIFDGESRPTPGDVEALHHEAHERCYIANSVRTLVTIAGRAQGCLASS